MARGGNLDWESQMKVVVVVVRERDFHFHPGLTSCFVVTSSLHSSSSRRSNFGAVRRTAGTPRFHRLDRTVWENVFFFSLWRMLILTCAEILVGLHLSPIYSSSLSLCGAQHWKLRDSNDQRAIDGRRQPKHFLSFHRVCERTHGLFYFIFATRSKVSLSLRIPFPTRWWIPPVGSQSPKMTLSASQTGYSTIGLIVCWYKLAEKGLFLKKKNE